MKSKTHHAFRDEFQRYLDERKRYLGEKRRMMLRSMDIYVIGGPFDDTTVQRHILTDPAPPILKMKSRTFATPADYPDHSVPCIEEHEYELLQVRIDDEFELVYVWRG